MWASKLPYVEYGINTTVNISMGKPPYELVFETLVTCGYYIG